KPGPATMNVQPAQPELQRMRTGQDAYAGQGLSRACSTASCAVRRVQPDSWPMTEAMIVFAARALSFE
ncbi:MAG: hypothetical protein CMO44_10565, partial [Verrucomicrobiales bacterium]|nr:hypothetical protein [Verrucomicrobiales bacterium]